jgi:hypothetical protein
VALPLLSSHQHVVDQTGCPKLTFLEGWYSFVVAGVKLHRCPDIAQLSASVMIALLVIIVLAAIPNAEDGGAYAAYCNLMQFDNQAFHMMWRER